MSAPVRVKRDGPRGWHWIAAANFNPAVHALCDETGAALADEPAKKPEPKVEPKTAKGKRAPK